MPTKPPSPPSPREKEYSERDMIAWQKKFAETRRLPYMDRMSLSVLISQITNAFERPKPPPVRIPASKRAEYEKDRKSLIACIIQAIPLACKVYPQSDLLAWLSRNLRPIISLFLNSVINPAEESPTTEGTSYKDFFSRCCTQPNKNAHERLVERRASISQQERLREPSREEEIKKKKWKARRILMDWLHTNKPSCVLHKNICDLIRLYDKPIWPYNRHHIEKSQKLLKDLVDISAPHMAGRVLAFQLENRIDAEYNQLEPQDHDRGEYSTMLVKCSQKIKNYKKRYGITAENDFQTLFDIFTSNR